MSVLSELHIGSSFSLRGYCRLGSTLSIANHIEFANSNKNTYVHYSSTNEQLEVYVQAKRGISVHSYIKSGTTYAGGILHGTWYSDYLVHTSDRNLKKNIQPLEETLSRRGRKAGGSANASNPDNAAWLLRELRPVSYQFKKDAEAKAAHRFGFIADEVSEVIPQVVRELPLKSEGKTPYQGIVYQDFIALLTAAFQSMQTALETQTAELRELRSELRSRAARSESLEARLYNLEVKLEKTLEKLIII
jgi:hypothetical protein